MKKHFFSLFVLTLVFVRAGAEEPLASLPTLSLSIEEYTQMAFNRGIQSQISEENLRTAEWSWLAGKRQLTWPQITSQFSGSKSFSDTDFGSETETESQSATLSLTQPFLTGTSVGLSGTVTTTDSETDSSGFISESKIRDRPNVTASVTQPLYLFVENSQKRNWETNNLQWENTREIHKSDQLNIEFNARQFYFDLLLASSTVEIEKRKLASTNRLEEITRNLIDRGRLSGSELTRVEVVRQEDKRRLENAQTRLDQSWNQAKDFVLLPPAQETYLTTPLTFKPLAPTIDQLISMGEKSNPFLTISRNNVRFAEISLEQTREGTRPTVDLSGSYTKNTDKSLDETIEPYSWDARVDMNWTLFDASQTRLSTKQSQASLRNARRNFENDFRQLKVNLRNAHLDVKRIEGQVAELEKEVQLSRESRDALRKKFRNGQAGLTDVFDAEDRLRRVEQDYIELLVSFNNAVDRLKVQVGGDLSF